MTEIERRIKALETTAERRKKATENAETIDINDYIADVYKPVHDDIAAGRHRYYNLKGGRGSAKSSFASLEIVNGIMQDSSGQSSAIVFRRYATTLRESAYSQIQWAIDTLGVNAYWRAQISPMRYIYEPTGAQIVFRGLDDVSKLKSVKPERGAFRFIWLEEFSELPGENFLRSVMQSVIRGQDAFTVFRTFNPPLSKNNWANMFAARTDPQTLTLHTTYNDIPREWLGEAFLYEAERLQEVNPAAYAHEYGGEAIGAGGEVFTNLVIRTITDEEINAMQYIYCGLDFGFAQDPAAFIRLAYDHKTESIYLLDEIYRRQMSNADTAAAIKAKGYDKNEFTAYRPIWNDYKCDSQTVICDCAEPKSIADLNKLNIRAIACKKYPGSVIYGVKWLQRRQIIIDPARTPAAHKEFTAYEYMRSKDGELLADLPDKDNHTIDAVRYALDRVINNARNSA